jgi:cell shape-determining protein MreC
VVLGLLVACSLILLTASFGGDGGAVGSVQRGFSEVLNPVQEGASRALKPVRDLFGWFGDTFSAKGKLADVTAERDQLRQEVLKYQDAQSENELLRRQLNLNRSLGIGASSRSPRPSGTRRSRSTRAPRTACATGCPCSTRTASSAPCRRRRAPPPS